MFYEQHAINLDFSLPIFARSLDGAVLLLVPQHGEDSYVIVGYDWLNIATGKYNSCGAFATPIEAINTYKTGYRLFNQSIITKGIF